MLSEDLQIYRDTYELAKALYRYYNNIPKGLKYGEYGHVLSMALDALDMIYVANSDVAERYWALTRYLQLVGGIRARIRLFGELSYLSPKQSTCLLRIVEKVQRQATGWRNSQARAAESRQGGRAVVR